MLTICFLKSFICWSQARVINKFALNLFCMIFLSYVVLISESLAFLNQIIPASCRYEVLSTKIEIRLAKAEQIHWTSLEFQGAITASQRANVSSGNFRFIWSFQLLFPIFLQVWSLVTSEKLMCFLFVWCESIYMVNFSNIG